MDLTSELESKEHETPTDMDNTKSLMITRSSESSQENSTDCKPRTSYSTPSLPPEILFSILLRAIPPYNLLNTTLSPGAKSPWCQTLHLMQSVVLVCRSWYGVGITFLYENICIRRCHQLESLRWTLTSSAVKHLSLMVKSLTIQCYVPENRGIDIGTDLEIIMGCCTSLSTFSYNARFVPPAGVIPISFPTHITHFRLEGDFDFDQLYPVLNHLKDTLLSLHLMIWDDNFINSVKNQDIWSQQLHLPSLQFLSLTMSWQSDFELLNLLRCQLMLPALQRLTVTGLESARVLSHQRLLLRFLESYGAQLQQLHLSELRFTPQDFIRILASCPQLERIILHASTFLREHWTDSHEFFHPNLRWIDFIHRLSQKDIYRSSESALHLLKKNLPALEPVRRFCNFVGESLNWLDDCPPNIGTEGEEFVIGIFQHQLDCREGVFVWRFERDVSDDKEVHLLGSFTIWEEGNTDSDSDYTPTDSDEWDSSSSEDPEDEDVNGK